MTNAAPNTLNTCQGRFALFDAPMPAVWMRLARDKGFAAIARIIDRYHVALACVRCGMVNRVKVYTLRTARPQCAHCQRIAREEKAEAAGVIYLGRDPHDPHYALLRLPCGHDVSRQLELLDRAAQGVAHFRCEICLRKTEEEEAAMQGWTRLGTDPEGNPSYRLYRHNPCSARQRIGRANMQSGRVICAACGTAWPAAPSAIYLIAFTLASGREVVKLGFSRNPTSRLAFQLRRNAAMPCAILTSIPMPSGHVALCVEKRLHKNLRARFPDALVDPNEWRGQIRVKSEIYDAQIRDEILAMLEAIDVHGVAALVKHGASKPRRCGRQNADARDGR